MKHQPVIERTQRVRDDPWEGGDQVGIARTCLRPSRAGEHIRRTSET